MKTEFVVKVSSAKMPVRCKVTYKRVALMEVLKGTQPKMISVRAKGVVRIVRTWERLSANGRNTNFSRALAEAESLARSMLKG